MIKESLCVLLLVVDLSLSAFEKLPSQYQVAYGDNNAPVQVIEYFSLSCPKCLEIFRKDFKDLRTKFVTTKNAHWVFHPHPADLLTLQAMVCLEKLSQEEKKIFWEVLINNLENPSDGGFIMQTAMETLGKPVPKLADLDYLQNTPTFQAAFQYLKQADVVKELPTVEMNGVIYDTFPNRKFLEKKISSLLSMRNHL